VNAAEKEVAIMTIARKKVKAFFRFLLFIYNILPLISVFKVLLQARSKSKEKFPA